MKRTLIITLLIFLVASAAQATYPEDGWWWDPDAPGRGYLIERQDNVIFIASFHYAQDGSPEWLSIQGIYTPSESDDSIGEFNGTVYRSTDGQCLGCAWTEPMSVVSSQSPMTIVFDDNRNGTLEWSSEVVQISRFLWAWNDVVDQLAGNWLLTLVEDGTQVSQLVSIEDAGGNGYAEVDNMVTGASVGTVELIDGDLVMTLADASETDLPLVMPESGRFYAGFTDADALQVVAVRLDDMPIVISDGSSTRNAPWIVNETGETAAILTNNGTDILVNVANVSTVTVDTKEYTYIQTSGVPSYQVTMTQDIIDTLNSRPDIADAFVSGATTASVGDVIEFGQDIGYASNATDCTVGAGYGYWPPGPVCPEDLNSNVYLPSAPEPKSTADSCETGGGSQGLWVNGASIFTWTDGQSYNNQGVWQSLAPIQEVYDVDICGGHAANGLYHQHQYSSCLADLVGDEGNGHSPIYGYAADGYPIYGPWQADGVLAKSSWAVREFDDANSITGCGVAGERSCHLVNSLDPSEGTTSVSSGPSTSDQVPNLTGLVQFTAVAGFYFEDYYWDSSLSGEEVLDQHNGHSDSERGYHYHVTLTEDANGTQTPSFPFIFGPEYYGVLQDNAITTCGLTNGGPGGGPPP